MFLHLGNGCVISNEEIIGIFDCSIFSGPEKEKGAGGLKAVKENRKLLDMEDKAGRVTGCLYDATGEKEKSIVLTDSRIYLSPVSPRALMGRVKSWQHTDR